MTFRELALRRMLFYARVGVHESGRNNRGALIDRWNRLAEVPLASSWCMTAIHGCFLEAGLDIGGALGDASVGFFDEWAHVHGFEVDRPQRGDIVSFEWESDRWFDHVGMVVRVLALRPRLTLLTVEGNTGPHGAVSDPGTGRDGVYRKVRIVRRSSVRFARIPGRPKHDLSPATRYRLVYRHGIPYTEPVKERRR